MDALVEQLKAKIIAHLNLTDIDPETVTADAPLFGPEGLGLDSIDALELVVILDKFYHVKVTNPESVREHFVSLRTLAEFIQQESVVA